MPACQNCRYFCVAQSQPLEALVLIDECRRRAPENPPEMSMRPEGMYAVHPIVAGDRWCGEYAPRAAKLRICRTE